MKRRPWHLKIGVLTKWRSYKRFFVDLPRKIAAATTFRAFNNFPLLLCFSQLLEGAPNSINSAKIAKNRGCNDFLHLITFRYFLVCLTYQTSFRIQQILRKLRKIVVTAICCTLRYFVTALLFSLNREGFRIQLIPRKVRKIVPLPSLYPFFFSSWSPSRTADVKLIALVSHWRLCFTRIDSCNRVDILSALGMIVH